MPYAKREDRINFLRKYYIRNREALKKATRDRRKNNPEHAKEIDKKAYWKNRAKKLVGHKKYYKNHREERLKISSEYAKNNKDKINFYKRNKYNSKYKLNAFFMKKLRERLYARRVLKPKLIKKYGGCQVCASMEKLQIHHKDYEQRTKNVLLLCKECHKIADLAQAKNSIL